MFCCCCRENEEPAELAENSNFSDRSVLVNLEESSVDLLDHDENALAEKGLLKAHNKAHAQLKDTLGEDFESLKMEEKKERFASSVLGLDREIAYVIVDKLLTEERRKARKRGKTEAVLFLKQAVATLDKPQQEELLEILRGLPAGVLGDEQAKSESRVLIDLYSDVHRALADEKHLRKDLGSLYEIAVPFYESYLVDSRSKEIVFHVISRQEPKLRLRSVLCQLILSRLVPAHFDSREVFLTNLFEL
eukprot:TRINITY_DN6355_c0_g1_i1.p1 TRINITY_DN6355_c0_g1~~TRINITY_DN6355_c0_g1_i1.p1  ORF type:complete len:248 (-),score=43.20 TRINITY_DN6355_c0_g1_i1:80-823(-)